MICLTEKDADLIANICRKYLEEDIKAFEAIQQTVDLLEQLDESVSGTEEWQEMKRNELVEAENKHGKVINDFNKIIELVSFGSEVVNG